MKIWRLILVRILLTKMRLLDLSSFGGFRLRFIQKFRKMLSSDTIERDDRICRKIQNYGVVDLKALWKIG